MASLTELSSIAQTANKQMRPEEESTIKYSDIQPLTSRQTKSYSLGDLEDVILSRHGYMANELLTRECFTKAAHSVDEWDICQVSDSNRKHDIGTQTGSSQTLQDQAHYIDGDSSVLFGVGVRGKHKQRLQFISTPTGPCLSFDYLPIVTFVNFVFSLHHHVGVRLQKNSFRSPQQTIGLLSWLRISVELYVVRLMCVSCMACRAIYVPRCS